MKIVYIINSLTTGGAELALYRLVTNNKNNSNIVISLMDEGVYGRQLINKGFVLYTLGMSRGRFSIKGLIKLFNMIKKIRPDVVQTWMYHADLIGGIIAYLAGARVIYWSLRNLNLDKDKSRLSTRIIVYFCAFFSRLIPKQIISNSIIASIAHTARGYSKNKFVYIPNGYDLKMFKPDLLAADKIRNELGIDSNIVLLGMVARWHRIKDHQNLFISLKNLLAVPVNNWKCVLVGPGITYENNELTHFLSKYNLLDYVQLLGSRDDTNNIFNALDIHISSSAGEAFSNVIAESMACGTPCIATNVGESEFILGNTGWIVPPQQPKLLTEAILNAINNRMNDPVSWSARELNCRKRIVHNFRIDQMVNSYNKIWNS